MRIEVNIPTSLNEITLEQYQKYLKIAENNEEGPFLDAKMIEIFCGIPLSDAYKVKMDSVNAIVDILNELFQEKPKHIEVFKMNGIEYGFIPDLNEMSLGEYIDLDTYVSDWDKMHYAMSVLYRPIKSSSRGLYNIEEYTLGKELDMLKMPLSAVFGSIFFFYNLGMDLSKHTILYSNNQEEMETIQHQLTSQANGVGINQYMDWLTEILQDLKISLN